MFELLVLLVVMGVMCFFFGIVCPAALIIYEKLIKGNPKSIWELYNEI